MMVTALTRRVELSRQPAAARRELTAMLSDAGWDGDVDEVLLAVHEAMVNAQNHGGGVTRAGAGFDGRSLVVEIADRGRGFQVPDSAGVPEVTAERGRGLFLIRHLASDTRLVRDGAEVRLVLTFDR